MKLALNVVGCLALVLALLGIFLPLLPTTPFLLLASACYMRSSSRMHAWMLNHRLFGEYLRNFESGRGIPLRAKIVALTLLWLSMGFSIRTVDSLLLQILLLLVGAGVSAYLVRMKTLRK
jgi:uncharacterized protein